MKLKEFEYKNVLIEIEVDEKGLFNGSALGIFRVYKYEKIAEGFSELKDAENAIKKVVNVFLMKTPVNYKELAKAIETSLVWTGYEECHCEPFIIKTLIENFMTYKNSK